MRPTRRRSHAFPAALALLLAACSAAPTAPETPLPAGVTLDREEVVLTAVGEIAALAARSGGRIVPLPPLSLVSEFRYLHDLPVLDTAALASGTVRAAAPGSATLRVEGSAAPLRVHVRPTRPLLLSVAPAGPVGDGDTIRLRGYRLQELSPGAVRVGTDAASVLSRDSATLRVAVPTLPAGACASGAARDTVRAAGADAVPGLVVVRKRRGELELRVGEPRLLPAESRACLRLGGVPGARYALAFLDTRRVRRAESGFEGYAPSPALYSVTVAEAGSAAPAAFSPSAAGARSVAHAFAAPGRVEVVRRAAPWREGDRFPLAELGEAGSATARVARVYGGHLVLAVAEGEVPAGGAEEWLARADSAFGMAVSGGYPVLRAALTRTLPLTSAGSGQLLVVARRDPGGPAGASATLTVEGEKRSYLLLNTAFESSTTGMLRTLVHELAHAWQEQYARESRPAGAAGSGVGAAWAVEGTADLLAAVALARVNGIGITGNWEWAPRLGDARHAAYALLAANARGELAQGYESGASFLLDLATRRLRRGEAEEEALAAVARGALEGWHGHDAHGARREGLTARMRRALGAEWEPRDALLRWTLSQAVDDLTADPELQNHAFRRVSTAGAATAVGWLAPVVLRSGGRAVRGDPGAPTEVAGNAGTIRWSYGSPNYFLIEDDGFGGAYTLGASWNGASLEGVEWMIVRYR